LDHVAFACADRAELADWQSRLDALGIKHGGIVDAHYGSGLSFKDPDGVALEFFAPPAA
jgi:catechol-2,3-dioxygenase